jgi:hypothetical protein
VADAFRRVIFLEGISVLIQPNQDWSGLILDALGAGFCYLGFFILKKGYHEGVHSHGGWSGGGGGSSGGGAGR